MANNPYIPDFIENPGKQLLNSFMGWGGNQAIPMPGQLGGESLSGFENFQTIANNQQTYGGTPGLNPGSSGWFNDWQNSTGFLGKNSMFGGVNDQGVATTGWVAPVLGGVSSLAQSWLGMQMLDQSKEELALKKDAFQFGKDFSIAQYNTQADTLNTAMRDRQAARVGANPNAYQSVGDYMKQNEVKQYG